MFDLIDIIMRPQFLIYLMIGVSAFATVLAIAMPLLNSDRVDQRIKVMATERDKMRSARLSDFKGAEATSRLRQKPKGMMQQVVDALDLKNKFETDELKNKLKMAGLRGPAPLYAYAFFRLVMPILIFIGAILYLFVLNPQLGYPAFVKLMIALGGGYLGYYLPNMFVENMVQRRQQALKAAFPDSLDMLLICVQSGMSIEAAFGKVASEITSQSMELAEELSLTTAELSYLQDRKKAYENLGKRTGLNGIKAVSTALIQAEQYGTPLAQALRIMAKENRDLRMSEAEKKAAALPPKLTVPMIVFNLPVLFVVILGPAIIQVMKWE
ncbi:MAG: type II secretion system F family protein [Hyphomicrobiaceae bacterium]